MPCNIKKSRIIWKQKFDFTRSNASADTSRNSGSYEICTDTNFLENVIIAVEK